MTRNVAGRRLVLGVSLLALVGFGCTPETVTPTPPPTSPVSATPTETAQEREERLAYAAAEKSYREFRAELYRVLRAGGSEKATAKMMATADGPYLSNFVDLIRAYKEVGLRSRGEEKTGYVLKAGYSPSAVTLDVCEDSTGVRDFDKQGHYKGKGEIRAVRLEVRKEQGRWKLWDGDGKKVDNCDR